MTSDKLRKRGYDLQRQIADINREGTITGKHTLQEIRSMSIQQDALKRELRGIQRTLRAYA